MTNERLGAKLWHSLYKTNFYRQTTDVQRLFIAAATALRQEVESKWVGQAAQD